MIWRRCSSMIIKTNKINIKLWRANARCIDDHIRYLYGKSHAERLNIQIDTWKCGINVFVECAKTHQWRPMNTRFEWYLRLTEWASPIGGMFLWMKVEFFTIQIPGMIKIYVNKKKCMLKNYHWVHKFECLFWNIWILHIIKNGIWKWKQ